MRKDTREIAILKGKNKYFGEPCKNCGSEEKYVKGCHCIKCFLERSKAAKRQKQ
jgi:hypothetical protein